MTKSTCRAIARRIRDNDIDRTNRYEIGSKVYYIHRSLRNAGHDYEIYGQSWDADYCGVINPPLVATAAVSADHTITVTPID